MKEKRKISGRHAAGAFLSILGGFCWGTSGTMGQYLFDYQGMDSRWLTPIRLFAAGVILMVYSLVRYRPAAVLKPWTDGRRSRIDLLVYGLLGISACQFLYFTTIMLSTAGVGTILQDLSPAMILLVTCAQHKRRPDAREILCIILAFCGAVLITTHGALPFLPALPGIGTGVEGSAPAAVPLSALICGVLCAVGVTIYNVEPAKLLADNPIPVLQAWAFLMGGSVLSLMFHPWTWDYRPNAMGLFGIFFVVVVGNIVAFSAYMEGVKRIGPNLAILYGFAEPVTAAVLTFFLFGSPFTAADGIGFAMIFLMMVLISRKGS